MRSKLTDDANAGLVHLEEGRVIFENYLIFPSGQIYNKHGMRMNYTTTSRGYLIVDLNGKTYKVHRLMAEIFIPNNDLRKVVAFKNGRRDDVRVENLKWSSQSEVMKNYHKYKKPTR